MYVYFFFSCMCVCVCVHRRSDICSGGYLCIPPGGPPLISSLFFSFPRKHSGGKIQGVKKKKLQCVVISEKKKKRRRERAYNTYKNFIRPHQHTHTKLQKGGERKKNLANPKSKSLLRTSSKKSSPFNATKITFENFPPFGMIVGGWIATATDMREITARMRIFI